MTRLIRGRETDRGPLKVTNVAIVIRAMTNHSRGVRLRSLKQNASVTPRPVTGFGVLLILAALAASCTSSRTKWEGRVGIYSYQEALLDLGKPLKSEQLSDGTIIVDWMTHDAEQMEVVTPFALRTAPGQPTVDRIEYSRRMTNSMLNSPAQYLRLVFGPNRKLKAWELMTH